MPGDILDEFTTRTPLDYFHFALASLGLVVAASGVILSSAGVGLCGLVLVVWGLGYFAAD
ncbi:MAG TPA: hypothetical protein VFC07_00345 [Verrucomicrobiae bacterium]|nr:hypothetical protein [Verrucomicrobiae bacterium]